MKNDFMYHIPKNYPKTCEKLMRWTLPTFRGDISQLNYTYDRYTQTFGVYYKSNGNGRSYDIRRLFDFFQSQKLNIYKSEYKDREFEPLFQRLESML